MFFKTQSTKTISNKLIHAKIKVQSLQNDFVKCVLSPLWFNRIQLSGVSRRKNVSHLWKIDIMSFFFTYNRTSSISFQYIMRHNENEILIDCVKAITDDCFWFKINFQQALLLKSTTNHFFLRGIAIHWNIINLRSRGSIPIG